MDRLSGDVRRRLAVLVAVALVAVALTAAIRAVLADGSSAADRLPPPAPPAGGPRLVAYWPSWSTGIALRDIPGGSLSTLVYFTAGVSDGRCVLGDPERDLGSTAGELGGNFAELRDLRARHPELKVVMAVFAPWKGERPDGAVSTPEGRAALADSCVSMFVDGRLPGLAEPVPGLFDGIDLDWEYPPATSRDDHARLLAALRARLDASGPGHLLTTAIPAWTDADQRFALGDLAGSVDWINLMAYDLVVASEPVSGFPAALAGAGASIDGAVSAFRAAGVPTGKVVVGVPMYGQSWRGATTPGEVATGAGDPKVLGWSTLEQRTPTGIDPTAAQAWSTLDGTMTVYDTPTTVEAKAAYVLSNGLGGLMLWHLGYDSADHGLMRAALDGLAPGYPAAIEPSGSS